MIVYSRTPLTKLEKTRIKEICKQSHCPNESLKNTFDRFSFMQGNNIIYFDDITIQNRHKVLCTQIEV